MIETGTTILHTVLGQALGTWEERARALGRDRSLKAVHDFRVATRRLTAAVEIGLKTAGGGPPSVKKDLKAWLKKTGPLSDVQTSIRISREQCGRWPDLEHVCGFLVGQEKDLLAGLDGGVPEEEIAGIAGMVCRIAPADGMEHAPVVSLNLLLGLETRLENETARLKKASRRMDPDEGDSIHQLRIRVRRTRYIMELLRRFAGDAVLGNIEAAKSLQTLMGDIHDYEALIGNLHRMKESVEGGRCDLAGLEDALVSHQRKMVARLMKSAKKLNRRLAASPLKTKGSTPGGRTPSVPRGGTVVLLRHGTALDRSTPGIPDDASRPLTKQGKKEAKNAGRAIKALGLKTDRVLTSPLLRALETATIAAVQLGLQKKLEITEELSPGGALEAVAARLAALRDGSGVLLVGHEPFLSSLAAHLLGAEGASIALKKGGALVLRSRGSGNGRTYSLESLMTPPQLKALG